MPHVRDPLVWIDLEMTGLDHEACHIIEIATIVTSSELEILAEGPSLVVHQDEAALETLSDWSREHFTKSGLLDRVRASETSNEAAEAAVLSFLEKWTSPQSSPLCGNSVHTDRAFLQTRMPRLLRHLHYRNVDVSTLKELLRRWHPRQYAPPPKAGLHEARADLYDSIAELRYYRDAFIAPRVKPEPN